MNGTITTSDGYFTIIRNTSSYGNVTRSSSVNPTTPFRLRINPSCPTPYFGNITLTLTESRGYNSVQVYSIVVGNSGFADDIESGSFGYVASNAAVVSNRKVSGSNSWYLGNSSIFSYRDTIENTLTTPSIIAPATPVLYYSTYYATEEGYDFCRVKLSTDGSSWTTIDSFSGASKEWKLKRKSLSSYVTAGTSFQIRFSLDADEAVHDEGFYVDDIFVVTEQDAYLGASDVTPWAGLTTTEFDIEVNYLSPTGATPINATAYINGTPYAMTLSSGTASVGAKYSYSTTLPPGASNYYFVFNTSSGSIRYPLTGTLLGPHINASPYITFDIGSSSSSFTHSGTVDDWEWGVPSSGPGSTGLPSGSNVWATKLSTTYRNNSDSRLLSPSINLNGINHPYLLFWHWYQFQPANTNGTHDGGNIKISVDGGDEFIVYPQHGYDTQLSSYPAIDSIEPAFTDTNNGNFWQFEAIDLSPWQGHSVQFYFDMGSSTRTTDYGWYINNIFVLGSFATAMNEDYFSMMPEQVDFNAYPNPFNSAATILIENPNDTYASLQIFDLKGNLIQNIFQKELTKGTHFVSWEADNYPNGVYFVKLTTTSRTQTQRILLIK